MATKHGSIGVFDSTEEDWESYVERVNLYFVANDIEDAAKKRAVLLTECGAKTYRVIRDLVAPAPPSEVAFDDIVGMEAEKCTFLCLKFRLEFPMRNETPL